MAHSSTKP